MRASSPAWLASLLSLAACGGGTLSAGEFPAAFARAVCQPQAACRTLSARSETRCEADVRALYGDDLGKAIAGKRSRFDALLARQCLDGMSARGCGRPTDDVALACTNATGGAVAPGASCSWVFECQSGLCTPAQPGACPATCPPVLGAGAACPGKANAQCDDRLGLRCIGGTCSLLHAAPAPCTFDGDCHAGLFCDGSACAVRRGESASCGADSECAEGLYCQLTAEGGLCRKQVAAGQRCCEDADHAGSAASQCKPGLVCRGCVAAKGSTTPGTCAAAGEPGSSCIATASEGFTGCARDLLCQAGRCVAAPSTGPCANGDCLDGVAFCDDAGQCQPLRVAGAACTASSQCATSFCPAASGRCEESEGSCHEP